MADHVTDELVEKAARAILAARGFCHADDDRMFIPVKWEELDDDDYPVVRAGFLAEARAALEAVAPMIAAKARAEALEEAANVAIAVTDQFNFPALDTAIRRKFRALQTTSAGTVTPPLDHNGMPAKFQTGDEVQKVTGYPWPGEVRAAYTTRAGQWRYVVECTVPEVAGAQHIFNGEQLALGDGK